MAAVHFRGHNLRISGSITGKQDDIEFAETTILAECKCGAGKEYPRTQFMTFDNKEEALQTRFEKSKYYLSLNGTWKFFSWTVISNYLHISLTPQSHLPDGKILLFRVTGRYRVLGLLFM